MVVIVLTACPEGLRGHLTRWLLEISAGVFVGNVTSRVRDLLWARVVELSREGRALMVYRQRNEQGLASKVHRHHWERIDNDGVFLMRRPLSMASAPTYGRTGWSRAGRRKRFGQRRAEDRPPGGGVASEVNENGADRG